MDNPTILPDPTSLHLVQLEAEVTEQIAQDTPWHRGMSRRQEEKSHLFHQEQVERYQKIHGLSAKKIEPATIARQLGLSRQTVYNYLHI